MFMDNRSLSNGEEMQIYRLASVGCFACSMGCTIKLSVILHFARLHQDQITLVAC